MRDQHKNNNSIDATTHPGNIAASLETFAGATSQLQTSAAARVNVKKSSRISFALSPTAASRLEELSRCRDLQLPGLGVVNVRVGAGGRDINFISTTSTNGQLAALAQAGTKTTPHRASTKRGSGSGSSSRSAKFAQSAANPNVPSTSKLQPHEMLDSKRGMNGDAGSVVQQFINALAAQRADNAAVSGGTSNSAIGLLQPNVVATTSQPIPVLSQPVSSHIAPTGPFPFASMTKVAFTIKTTSSPLHAPSAPPLLATSMVSLQPTVIREEVVPGSMENNQKAHSPSGKNRNIALTSPLLVNLLQGTEPQQMPTSSSGEKRPKKRQKKVVESVAGTAVPVTKIATARPKKRKKLSDDLNGLIAHFPPLQQSPLISVLPAAPVEFGEKKADRSIASMLSSNPPASVGMSASAVSLASSQSPPVITVLALTSSSGLTRTSSSSDLLRTSSTFAVTTTKHGASKSSITMSTTMPVLHLDNKELKFVSSIPATPNGRKPQKSAVPLVNGENSGSSLDSGISLSVPLEDSRGTVTTSSPDLRRSCGSADLIIPERSSANCTSSTQLTVPEKGENLFVLPAASPLDVWSHSSIAGHDIPTSELAIYPVNGPTTQDDGNHVVASGESVMSSCFSGTSFRQPIVPKEISTFSFAVKKPTQASPESSSAILLPLVGSGSSRERTSSGAGGQATNHVEFATQM